MNASIEKYISQIANINASFQTIKQHLIDVNYGLVRLEMDNLVILINKLNEAITYLENIGRQPEEHVNINTARNYFDNILVIL
ncbi:hypothetical protein I4U23_030558 [Adineta vaga]|nr:hypothetical protein I4U23_030558 [Adineta vaga]